MEKIDPQPDHLGLERYRPGTQVTYKGKRYSIQRRTTLASGEAAVVLQSDTEQFFVSANQFLAAISS
jgi:hypothetical protein